MGTSVPDWAEQSAGIRAFGRDVFGRIVVAEVDRALVDAVRANDGTYAVNVARRGGIEAVRVDGVEMFDPSEAAERDMLVHALAGASEMATCLPSTDFYDRGDEANVADILGRAFSLRPTLRRIVYAAENDTRAAEKLSDCVRREAGLGVRGVRFLNTTIGKMSQLTQAGRKIQGHSLKPVAPGLDRAFLVEEGNHILVSECELSGFESGLTGFERKPELRPFLEAKLYGHNAIHCILAFLAARRGYDRMPELRGDDELMELGRRAFIDEVGEALLRKYKGLDDELFTPDGFTAYAEDLLERMTNPYLDDAVDRVARDPVRKLGPEDRVFGAMRLVLRYELKPRGLARGAAAGIDYVLRRADELDLPDRLRFESADAMNEDDMAAVLEWLWGARPRAVESAGDIPALLAAAGD